ncbi:MAG TPA: hypothetical protein VKU41_32515 [Polyangiaceae bacterium]|nr:hypothetical protein [Polyangiaceae bacterium]
MIHIGDRGGACVALIASAAALAACEDSVADGYYGAYEADVQAGASAGASVSAGGGASASASAGAGAEGGAEAGANVSTDAEAGATATSGPCDLSGRWLVALRMVTTALGTTTAAHEWFYYEISQSGAEVTVSKGLHCGENTHGISAVSGNADFPKVWPAMLSKTTDTGRKGASASAAGGCQVSFEKRYEVISATNPYYLDPSKTLPTASEQASGSTPGWEDWDQDGQPGFTMSISGIASGQLYMTTRAWTSMSGKVASATTSFDLPLDWNSEQSVLGVNGPPILSQSASATKDSDASQHFATFVRLTDKQATGDDASVCSTIRSLAPTVASKASN